MMSQKIFAVLFGTLALLATLADATPQCPSPEMFREKEGKGCSLHETRSKLTCGYGTRRCCNKNFIDTKCECKNGKFQCEGVGQHACWASDWCPESPAAERECPLRKPNPVPDEYCQPQLQMCAFQPYKCCGKTYHRSHFFCDDSHVGWMQHYDAGSNLCPQECIGQDPPPMPPGGGCRDSSKTFKDFRDKRRSCKWLKARKAKGWTRFVNNLCKWSDAKRVCRSTCGKCRTGGKGNGSNTGRHRPQTNKQRSGGKHNGDNKRAKARAARAKAAKTRKQRIAKAKANRAAKARAIRAKKAAAKARKAKARKARAARLRAARLRRRGRGGN